MIKASKASVHYESRATGADYCGICSHFEKSDKAAKHTCAVVLGNVNFKGWCEEFKKRARPDR